MARIYVASSWRNQYQPGVIRLLRELGHDPCDFRNPDHATAGFQWSDVDPNWQSWDSQQYRIGLGHPTATRGFSRDLEALLHADAYLLVLPSGRSAHLEAGFTCGRRETAVYMPEPQEPELMCKLFDRILLSHSELVEWANNLGSYRPSP